MTKRNMACAFVWIIGFPLRLITAFFMGLTISLAFPFWLLSDLYDYGCKKQSWSCFGCKALKDTWQEWFIIFLVKGKWG